MTEKPYRIWSDGERYVTVSYIENLNTDILFMSMDSICDELNELYEEKEFYKTILKGIMTGVSRNQQWCELTVSFPCHKYDELRELMLNE